MTSTSNSNYITATSQFSPLGFNNVAYVRTNQTVISYQQFAFDFSGLTTTNYIVPTTTAVGIFNGTDNYSVANTELQITITGKLNGEYKASGLYGSANNQCSAILPFNVADSNIIYRGYGNGRIFGDYIFSPGIADYVPRSTSYIANNEIPQFYSNYSEIQKIIPTGYSQSVVNSSNIGFGYSLDIDQETGTHMLVSAPYDDASRGSFYYFKRFGTGWTQVGSKVLCSNITVNSFLGSSVKLNYTGDVAAVITRKDAAGNDVGGVYMYTRNNTTWIQTPDSPLSNASYVAGINIPTYGEPLLDKIAMDYSGNYVAFGRNQSLTSNGQVIIYKKLYTSWVQTDNIVGTSGKAFGSAVAFNGVGNILAAGYLGSTYIYSRSNNINTSTDDWTSSVVVYTQTSTNNQQVLGCALDATGNLLLTTPNAKQAQAAPLTDNFLYNRYDGSVTSLTVSVQTISAFATLNGAGNTFLSPDGTLALIGSPKSNPAPSGSANTVNGSNTLFQRFGLGNDFAHPLTPSEVPGPSTWKMANSYIVPTNRSATGANNQLGNMYSSAISNNYMVAGDYGDGGTSTNTSMIGAVWSWYIR